METQLNAMLPDAATVKITPSDNAQASSLELDLAIEHKFHRIDDLFLSLESILGSYNSEADAAVIGE